MFFENIKKALVVAAHPDDEVLGCGGTVARLTNEGVTVKIIILATGALSRDSANNQDVQALKHSAKESAKILGVSDIIFGSFPDNKMDTVALLDIIKFIESHTRDFFPNLVFTHCSSDLNIDHQLCHEAVLTAFRPLPKSSVKTILTFETVSSTEYAFGTRERFKPNFFVEIDKFSRQKADALGAYKEEMRKFPHPRSVKHIKNLAVVRGAEVGLNQCEAFNLVRNITPLT